MTISKHQYTAAVITTRRLPESREFYTYSKYFTWARPANWPAARSQISVWNGPYAYDGRTGAWNIQLEPGTLSGTTTMVTEIKGLIPGRRYTASIVVRSGSVLCPTVTFGPTSFLTSPVWERISYTFTATDTTHNPTVTSSLASASTIGNYLHFDELILTAHPYNYPPVETPLRLTDGTVTLDESWSPYADASLTLPRPDPATMAIIDPRALPRLRLRAVQSFGTSQPISALTAAIGPAATAATLSARYAGQGVASLSAEFGRGFNPEGVRSSTRRVWDLAIRSRTVDQIAGQVTLSATSDEGLLMDYAPAMQLQTPLTVRGAVAVALARIGALLEPGTDDSAITSDAAVWSPGMSAWEFVSSLVDAAGLRLYCDEQRRWFLVKPLQASSGALYFSEAMITEAEDQISRDDGWFDALTVTYKWTDSAGVSHVRHDVADPAGYTKMGTILYERPWPGDGAAAALLARAQGRGQITQVAAVSNYTAAPGAYLRVSLDDAPQQTGVVSRVEWRLTTDEMSVRSRDLIETPPMSWLARPIGETWNAQPTGMSWATYTPLPQ